MPLGICEALAILGGGALAGTGSGIAASMEADATKDAAKMNQEGPVRGGSERAGNKGQVGVMPDASVLEKLGQTSLPLRSPVYGGMPVDMNSLFKPQNFGAGFSRGVNPQYRVG